MYELSSGTCAKTKATRSRGQSISKQPRQRALPRAGLVDILTAAMTIRFTLVFFLAVITAPAATFCCDPVYCALSQFNDKMDSSMEEAQAFVASIEHLEKRMAKAFPNLFADARKTMRQNLEAMKEALEMGAARERDRR